MEARETPTCRCGHDKHHPVVSPAAQYTFLGWFLTLMGISARPTSIRFICRRCEEVVETTSDPKLIAETRLWG
ncbi:MAG: hypothetical protein HOV80_03125 [Polyangiaceae bacterium]|nr:hypothetical protein [Polyangiaceae bacterium]